jgi:hypothetical protein
MLCRGPDEPVNHFKLSPLGIVVSVFAMESTSNSKQWHTECPKIMQSYVD